MSASPTPMLPLFRVHMPESVMEPLKKVLLSGYIGQGPKVEEFEKGLAKLTGNPNVLTVNAGTSALHLAMRLAGVDHGSEVITSPMTCLHYTSSVLLPDRSTIQIGKIVSKKLPVEVLSMNLQTGRLEAKKVCGWTKLPITEKWYRIRCKSKRGARGPGGKYGVFLTADHQVLTLDGYKRVDSLKPGDKVATSQRALNPMQAQVVDGMMLGDGHVQQIRKGSTRYCVSHAEDQKEWFNLGTSAFEGFDPAISVKPAREGHQAVLTLETKKGIQWSSMREKWYSARCKIKIVPEDLQLTPATLAAWYMDDGSLTNGCPVFCTEGFDSQSLWRLFWKLADFGLRPTVHKISQNEKTTGKTGYRLRLPDTNYGPGDDTSAMAFFKLVAPYIPPSMRYKLPDEGLPAFDESLWKLGDAMPMFDEVDVEQATPPGKQNNWVYCIEVEDNHNFISGNIVLKNCTASNMPALERGANLVWADIDPWTGNIDPMDVQRKITSKTKAILAIHWGGYPCEIDELKAVAKKYGLPLIEDAAHAIGASYKGKPIGSHSDFVAFSFQAIKHLTTVDGGMLTCRKPEDYRRGKLLRWFGIDRETPRQDLRCEENILEAGYKFHMSDVMAVIGIEQLKYFDGILARARANAAFYQERLANVKGVRLLKYQSDRMSAYWLFTIRVRDRDGFQGFMGKNGVMVSRVHVRNDIHTAYAAFRRNLPGVDEFDAEQVSIPVGWWVTDEDREKIAKAIEEWASL